MKPKKRKWHWPFLRVNFGGAKEYACRHGQGHGGMHGCDGCCRKDPNFPKDVPQIVFDWDDEDEEQE